MKNTLTRLAQITLLVILLLDVLAVGLFIWASVTGGEIAFHYLVQAILMLAVSAPVICRFLMQEGVRVPIEFYREHYKTYLQDAFAEDKRREKRFFRALHAYARGDYSAAVRGFARLLKKTEAPAERFALLSFLGFSYEDMKLYDRALPLYRAAEATRPHPALCARIVFCENALSAQKNDP